MVAPTSPRTNEIIFAPTEVVIIDISTTDHSFTSVANAPIRALSFAAAGDIKVDTPNSTGKVIPSGSLAAGIQHVLVITKIWKVGTTATGLVGYR